MIDFLSVEFNSDEYKTKLTPKDYATYCIACDEADYKPKNWSEKIVPAIEKSNINDIGAYAIISTVSTLKKLGIHHAKLFEESDLDEELTPQDEDMMKRVNRMFDHKVKATPAINSFD